MNERWKRIAIIVGFVLAVFVIGTAIYTLFFKPSATKITPIQETIIPKELLEKLPPSGIGTLGGLSETTGKETEQTGTQALPKADTIAKGGVTKTTTLTSSRVFSPTLSKDGNGINYYDRGSGKFFSIAKDGTPQALSEKQFPNVENVSWNANGTKAVLEFPDGANVVYDFSAGTQVSLPAHWKDFHFSPQNDEVIAKSMSLDPNNRSLVITSADGSNTKAIASLGENADKVELNWAPHDQVIGFSDTGPSISGVGRKMILPIGKNAENLKGLTVEGFDFRSLWSPGGDSLVYSAVGSGNGYRPMMWVVDGRPNTIGNNRRSIGIETWADKCTFTNASTMYCAVPTALSENIGLQRALSENIPDDIIRVDIATGRKERIAIPDTSQSIASLNVSSDGSTLFFTGTRTGVLRSMRLK